MLTVSNVHYWHLDDNNTTALLLIVAIYHLGLRNGSVITKYYSTAFLNQRPLSLGPPNVSAMTLKNLVR
jgi:hypothetical protein